MWILGLKGLIVFFFVVFLVFLKIREKYLHEILFPSPFLLLFVRKLNTQLLQL